MTQSKQNASNRAFVLALQYVEANGFQIGECLPYGAVHPVHSKDSWHYYWFLAGGRKHGRGADINWPGGGAEERSRLTKLTPVLQAFGCGVIYDRTGHSNGPTVTHKTHVHADQGSYSNLGSGRVAILKCDLTVVDTQTILHMARAYRDNINDTATENRLRLVREASRRGGKDFPSGVKVVQQIIGAGLTGKWDAQSYKAHDATVKKLKTLWKKAGLFTGTVNTLWDADLDAALGRFRERY